MIDAEPWAKLLSRAEPSKLRAMVSHEFGAHDVENGILDTKLPDFSSVSQEQEYRLNHWAERIHLLSDSAGQIAVQSLRSVLSPSQRQALDDAGNQYDRSLWLYKHRPDLFESAIKATLIGEQQSRWPCSVFQAPQCLKVHQNIRRLTKFRQQVADLLLCSIRHVAVDVSRQVLESDREESDTLFVVGIHHNRLPEVVDRVKAGQLKGETLKRSDSISLTYHPATGLIEVFSEHFVMRQALSRLLARCLLDIKDVEQVVVIKKYDYQSLAEVTSLDFTGENLQWAKMTKVSLCYGHRQMTFQIDAHNPETIYQAASRQMGAQFRFGHYTLNQVTLSLRLHKENFWPERTVHIDLKHHHSCHLKVKSHKDRFLCHRLLDRWGLIR